MFNDKEQRSWLLVTAAWSELTRGTLWWLLSRPALLALGGCWVLYTAGEAVQLGLAQVATFLGWLFGGSG